MTWLRHMNDMVNTMSHKYFVHLNYLGKKSHKAWYQRKYNIKGW